MLIKNLQLGQLETNCYIVTDEASLQCAVIDPGDESNTVMDYLESNNLKAKAIFLTHGHFDHVGAADIVSEETGAPIYIHKEDACAPSAPDHYRFPANDAVQYYKDGDTIEIGSLKFRVIETPGHSRGSVTLWCQEALFVGDTLFRESCGRTDLPGGDMQTLLASLRRLSVFDDETEVYPGHMEATSMGREKRTNYYLKYALANR